MVGAKTMNKGHDEKVTKMVRPAAAPLAHKQAGQKLAVVLIRGSIDMNQQLKDTLRILGLYKKNHCIIVDNSPPILGMIIKVKDYITWGEVSEQTFKELVEKRGKEFKARETDSKKKYSYRTLNYNSKKYKPYFALNPPIKGFGRKGIKVAFRAGGALGNRGEKINDLLKRMI